MSGDVWCICQIIWRIPILAHLALISHLSTKSHLSESKNVENHCEFYSLRELYTPVFGIMLVDTVTLEISSIQIFKYSSINELPASTCLKMFQVSKHVFEMFFQDESNCTLGVARTPGACAKNSLTAKVLN